MFIAPLLATRNELIGRVAPPGARTEAYTWPVTAFVGGISIGSARRGPARRGAGLARRVRGRRGRACARVRRRRCVRAAPEHALVTPRRRQRYREMGMPLSAFTPQVREWFARAFEEPTAGAGAGLAGDRDRRAHADLRARPARARRSPRSCGGWTGSCAEPSRRTRTRLVYVSPLKALSYDVERNLRAPLRGIGADVRVGVRTGDTPQKERRDMLRHPPDILITTPESLYLMLTTQAREIFERHGVGDPRRDPRRRADQARRAPRDHARAARASRPSGDGPAHRPVRDAEPARGGRPLHGRPEAHVHGRRHRRAQAAGPPDPRAGRVDGRARAVRRSSSTRSPAARRRASRSGPRSTRKILELVQRAPLDDRLRQQPPRRRAARAAAQRARRQDEDAPPRSPAPTTARWRARSGR